MLDLWLIIHFIGLALGVGASFAALTLALATRSMPPAERGEFMRRASILGKNGSLRIAPADHLWPGHHDRSRRRRGNGVGRTHVPHQAHARGDPDRVGRLPAGTDAQGAVIRRCRRSGSNAHRQPHRAVARTFDRCLCRSGLPLARGSTLRTSAPRARHKTPLAHAGTRPSTCAT